MTKEECYKVFLDAISDVMDWATTHENKGEALQYIFGLYDMTRMLEGRIDQKERDDCGSD